MIHKITINNVVYLYKDLDEVIKVIQKAKEEKEHAGKMVWQLAFETYQNGRV